MQDREHELLGDLLGRRRRRHGCRRRGGPPCDDGSLRLPVTRTGTAALLACLAVSLLVGCGGSTAISGVVTYDGQPVANGAISFLPADGKGPASGGPIEAGEFHVDGIVPGQKIVQIVGVKEVPFARNSEDMAKMAATAAARGDRTGIIDRADVIPADAVGNNATVQVEPGHQQVEFHLQPPPAGTGRSPG